MGRGLRSACRRTNKGNLACDRGLEAAIEAARDGICVLGGGAASLGKICPVRLRLSGPFVQATSLTSWGWQGCEWQ